MIYRDIVAMGKLCEFYVSRGWDRWFDADGRGEYIRAVAALSRRARRRQ